MDITRSFSLFQTLSAIVLIIASIFLVLRMRKEIPGSIRNELNRTTSLIFLIFSGYIFFVFIMVGNVHYPIQPVTASMLLGSACFVYADIMLIKSLIQTINQKDKEIKQYIADLEREIFERKKAEGALLLLDKAAKTTRTGITIRDGNGRILYINPAEAEMHGYNAEDLLGEDITVFVTPDMRKPLALEELRDAKTWIRETVNYRKDGSVFPVKLVSDIVRDESGEPVAIVTTCEDISERKEQGRGTEAVPEPPGRAGDGAHPEAYGSSGEVRERDQGQKTYRRTDKVPGVLRQPYEPAEQDAFHGPL